MNRERTTVDSFAQSTGGFTFGMAFTLVVVVFAVAIPMFAHLCGEFSTTLQAPLAMFPAFVVSTSPWLPVLIGLAGTITLLAKERRLKPEFATKANIAAIVTTILVGGFTLFTIFLPIVQLIRALPR